MKTDEKSYVLCYCFSESISRIRETVLEFEKIPDNLDILNTFPYMESVYMNWIIVDLNKILSTSRCDEYKLSKFKNGFGKEIFNKVTEIESEHKILIKKINNNRNTFAAHLDKNYTDMGFSKSEVKRLGRQYKTDLSMLESKCETNERYATQDLQDDLIEIKELLNKCDLIWKNTMFFVSKNNSFLTKDN